MGFTTPSPAITQAYLNVAPMQKAGIAAGLCAYPILPGN